MASARESQMEKMVKASDEIKVAALSSAVAALASTVAALSSTATALASTATALASAATALASTATALSSATVALSSTDVAPSSTATTPSSTSLQDLPIEVVDDILMKAVIKEVMEKKLAKSAWVDYATRVIKRLRTVSSQWNYRLTTRWFEIELHCKLMRIDPTAVSVELTASRPCDASFFGFARLNNHIYCLDNYLDSDTGLYDDFSLHVFEVHDTTHCVKIIPLPKVKAISGIAACKRSNAIYVWQPDSAICVCTSRAAECRCDSTGRGSRPAVWHLLPDGDSGCHVLRWPTYVPPGDSSRCSTIKYIVFNDISVLDDGNLLALRCLSYMDDENDHILSVHKPNGLVIRNVLLSHAESLSNVAMKSNGNFVYAQHSSDACIIREVDEQGIEIRSFHWVHKCGFYDGNKQLSLDAGDRVIFHDGDDSLVFLDSELNFLGEAETPEGNWECFMLNADFDSETNEMIIMYIERDLLYLKLTF